MTPPTPKKQMCEFMGLLNYLREMWTKRSHMLQPILVIILKQVKFKWIDLEQKLLEEVKHIVAHNTLSAYKGFNKKFGMHTDDRNFQLGAVISQEVKTIAFYSKKSTNPKTR